MTHRPAHSWIRSWRYVPLAAEVAGEVRRVHPGATGLLVTETTSGRVYVHPSPSWLAGLLAAAEATGRSVGRMVSRHLYRGGGQRLDETTATAILEDV